MPSAKAIGQQARWEQMGFSDLARREWMLLRTLEEQIDPRATAILIIDMQNDYVADDGKFGKLGMNMKAIQAAIPAMNDLIAAARRTGVMVVWIRTTHSFKDALPNYVVGNVAKVNGRPFQESDFVVQEGTWGAELYHQMAPRMDSEIEVIKNAYGAFTNTPLDTYLKAKGIKTMLNIGTVTNVCVQCTAMQGWHLGYYSIIPCDAAASNDLPLHEAILKNYRIFFGYTPKNEEIISIWKKHTGTAASRSR
jgi:ureidoacrylate peracid hydrolase